jgi:hypothetical protein
VAWRGRLPSRPPVSGGRGGGAAPSILVSCRPSTRQGKRRDGATVGGWRFVPLAPLALAYGRASRPPCHGPPPPRRPSPRAPRDVVVNRPALDHGAVDPQSWRGGVAAAGQRCAGPAARVSTPSGRTSGYCRFSDAAGCPLCCRLLRLKYEQAHHTMRGMETLGCAPPGQSADSRHPRETRAHSNRSPVFG